MKTKSESFDYLNSLKAKYTKSEPDPTPYEMVTDTGSVFKAFNEYHQEITEGIFVRNHFESKIPEILTGKFVGLFSDISQGGADNTIVEYLNSLIPMKVKPVMKKVPRMVKDAQTNEVVQVKDADGKPVFDEVATQNPDGSIKEKAQPVFNLSKSAYSKISDAINKFHEPYKVLWEARAYAEKYSTTVDEVLFDRMNDYLWRNIMAVVYPDAIKGEFKHYLITIKRKLYYLGTRDKVKNQTVFGLWSEDGGSGKTTLLSALSSAVSGDHINKVKDPRSFFGNGFNKETAGYFGIGFRDEDQVGNKSQKDVIKGGADSETRTIEGKGENKVEIPSLCALLLAGNHNLSRSLFEDESHDQRRDACFEIIGNLVQFDEKSMGEWFKKMFAACPIDSDERTYTYCNPSHSEVEDRSAYILVKLHNQLGGSVSSHPEASTHGLLLKNYQEMLSCSPTRDQDTYYALKGLLKQPRFFTLRQTPQRQKFYIYNKETSDEYLKEMKREIPTAKVRWTRAWMKKRPHLDVPSVIHMLETSDDYDMSSPINYEGVLK